jgi:transposase-like protein
MPPVTDFPTKVPMVDCPKCGRRMKSGKPDPIFFAKGLADVHYKCESCGTTATRTVKIEGA